MTKKVLFEVRERSADPAFQVVEDENGQIQTHYGATYNSEANVSVGLKLGHIVSGAWIVAPSVFRLRLTGTGVVQFDSRDSAGTVTAVATYNISGATDQIEFPFAGNNAVAVRATFAGDITVEVI